MYQPAKSPDSEKPPVIEIQATAAIVCSMIPAKYNNSVGIQNGLRTKLYCNTIKQHKELLQLLDKSKMKYFFRPYEHEKSKRFVLYGLNTYPIDGLRGV